METGSQGSSYWRDARRPGHTFLGCSRFLCREPVPESICMCHLEPIESYEFCAAWPRQRIGMQAA